MHASDPHSLFIFLCSFPFFFFSPLPLSHTHSLPHHPRSASPSTVFWRLGVFQSPFVNVSDLAPPPLHPYVSMPPLVSLQFVSVQLRWDQCSSVQISPRYELHSVQSIYSGKLDEGFMYFRWNVVAKVWSSSNLSLCVTRVIARPFFYISPDKFSLILYSLMTTHVILHRSPLS